MPDHVLGHIDGDKFASVMDSEGMSNELREYGRSPRPGLYYLAAAAVAGIEYLLQEVIVDEWPFFH
jgi:hypothetical protein